MDNNGSVFLIRKTRLGLYRSLALFLDGVKSEVVDEDAIVEFDVSPGTHELYVKMDWCRSPKFRFNISADEKIFLVSQSYMQGWKSLLTLFYLVILINRVFTVERVSPTQFEEWSKVNYPP